MPASACLESLSSASARALACASFLLDNDVTNIATTEESSTLHGRFGERQVQAAPLGQPAHQPYDMATVIGMVWRKDRNGRDVICSCVFFLLRAIPNLAHLTGSVPEERGGCRLLKSTWGRFLI